MTSVPEASKESAEKQTSLLDGIFNFADCRGASDGWRASRRLIVGAPRCNGFTSTDHAVLDVDRQLWQSLVLSRVSCRRRRPQTLHNVNRSFYLVLFGDNWRHTTSRLETRWYERGKVTVTFSRSQTSPLLASYVKKWFVCEWLMCLLWRSCVLNIARSACDVSQRSRMNLKVADWRLKFVCERALWHRSLQCPDDLTVSRRTSRLVCLVI